MLATGHSCWWICKYLLMYVNWFLFAARHLIRHERCVHVWCGLYLKLFYITCIEYEDDFVNIVEFAACTAHCPKQQINLILWNWQCVRVWCAYVLYESFVTMLRPFDVMSWWLLFSKQMEYTLYWILFLYYTYYTIILSRGLIYSVASFCLTLNNANHLKLTMYKQRIVVGGCVE